MKILVAGDYCPREKVMTALEQGRYEIILGEIKRYTTEVDYSIVNLECPIVEKDAQAIEKCGPNLKSTIKAVDALKWTGFDGVTLANNHFLDYGESGVKDTIDACKKCGLDYVGGGMDAEEAAMILYKEKGNQRFAIVNCCEHEFSIATENTAGSNPLNIVKQYYAIQEAKKKANYVLVIVHGGVEHYWLPTKRMKEIYRFFIDIGADAVVNHHQHCYSGYEVYQEKPIFYGLGNFCFDGIGSGERWSTGYMVNIVFEEKKTEFTLIPYRQCDDRIGVYLMQGKDKESFFGKVKEYNQIISSDSKCEAAYLTWCKKHEDMYKSVLNPLYNRITRKLFDGRLGQKLIGKNKWLYVKDAIVNESHIERVRLIIDNYLK